MRGTIFGPTTGLIAGRGRATRAILWSDFLTGGYSGNDHAGDGFAFGPNPSGTGAAVAKINATSGNAVGVLQLSTGTTTTGRAGVDSWNSSNTFPYAQGVVEFESRVRLPSLSTVSDEYSVALGHCINSGASLVNDGCAFTYNRLSTGANWQAISRAGGSQTTLDTGVAVAANTWQKLGFVVNAAGTSVEFFIDGVSVGTISTNVATVASREGAWILKSAGTTARLLQLDYWLSAITFTTQR